MKQNRKELPFFGLKSPLEAPSQPTTAIPSRHTANPVVDHPDPVPHPQGCNTKTREGSAVSLMIDKLYKIV